jgi:hypothetical protein
LDYPCDIPTRKTYSFPQKIYSHNLNLEKKIETEHFSSNDIITTSDFYYNEKNHIDEVVNWLNTNEYLKETKFYVYDDIFINEPYRQDLIDKNIIAMPLVTKYYKNNRLLRKQKSTYGLFNSKFLLKSSMQAKGEQDYEIDFEVINYNHRKKGLEIKNKDEVVTSYIYDGTGIGVASILENTSYNEIDANIINEFKNSFTENEIENSITLLRNTYPNKMIKSIIQRPLIGVSKVIEPNGNFIIYDYDSFNRLNLIKDEDNNILKEYNYNYKLTPMHPIQVAPLSGEIIINYINDINDINDLPVLDVYNANISANIRGGIGNYQYQWRSVLNGPIISNKLNFISSIPCGTSKVHYLKIIDSTTGSELNLTLTQQSHICNQPLAVTSASNYTLDYKQGRVISVNAIGGSWQYKYQFFNNPPSHSNSYSVSAAVCPRTSIIPVKIIDAITNEYIAQNITVTVICQGYIWDEEEQHCFVAGTKITMADGNEKNIEDVNIGDKIATYNVKKEKIEIESVLNVVNPIHSRMVQLYFNNGVKNTNTLDHPYYVKNKGWASFNPELTKENYDLNVRSLENGDVVLFYNSKENKVEPIKLVDHKIIIKKQLTYNLDKVSKNHNFFANGILVHNKSSFTNSKPKN